ncbi:hypothetical protein H5410_008358 [Solanum commersonii]|uniref:RNase H type-1 domain-containing protein n=1 Tax=Solanum commersonii TaxID=4109 RepID=A0A9J6AFS7_SOLCO|nr:hypothetical protein H5410_008358 [Solanum commersonii]
MHSLFLGLGTNNQRRFEMQYMGWWCIQHRYRKIQLEVDSQPLIHWLNHEPPPWALNGVFGTLRLTNQLGNLQVQSHIERQSVQPTSYLNRVITPSIL